MSSEKTEKPTRKKLEEARKQGQVVKSTDLVETACMLAVILMLVCCERYLGDTMHSMVNIALEFVSGEHTMADEISRLYQIFATGVTVMIAVAVVGALAAIGSLAAQIGFRITFKPVMPNFNAVNPGPGLGRIFSMNSMISVAKMLVKTLFLAPVIWVSIENILPLISSAAYQPLGPLVHVLWRALVKILGVSMIAYLLMGAGDYGLQYWLFMRKQKMSKEEIKHEHKQQDGDPHMKRERRKRGRDIVKGVDGEAVMKANVVVTNPTHYAVAIHYAPHLHPLPIVVAKGTDDEAALIRQFAAQAGVPIVANPPVARALYRVWHDEPIPEDMFEVVAAILRWVDSVGPPRDLTLDTLP